jgi:hypothetical protein
MYTYMVVNIVSVDSVLGIPPVSWFTDRLLSLAREGLVKK